MSSIFSFDVFDTCLVRTQAAPTDLFYDLARGLLPAQDRNLRETVQEFVRARIEAETRARQMADREDITLDWIYQHFPELEIWSIDPEKARNLEIEIELDAVRPILSTLHRIRALRAEQARIIFVSDMYLPDETIRMMLETHGFAKPDDRLYVSGQIGLCKGSGRLFEHVMQEEGVAAREILHHGDNAHSDQSMPAALGIRTAPYHDFQLTRYENQTLQADNADPGDRSNLAGSSRAVRLAHCDPAETGHTLKEIAADVAAPFLTSYVAWVLHDAQERGVEKLFFISRDGQIFYRIAQTLLPYMQSAPECHYLYGSRQAWYLPSLFSVTRESLDWIAFGGGGHSWAPRTILKRLHLEPEEISEVLELHRFGSDSWTVELDEEALERFWNVLLHEKTSDLILERATRARRLLTDYLAQEEFEPGRSAFVDTGWSLRSQAAVRRALGREGDDSLWGYYMGVFQWHLPIREAGGYRAFYQENYDDDRSPDSFLRRFFPAYYPLVLEHVFTMCDHPSVSGYQRKGEKVVPVFSGAQHTEEMRTTVEGFQQVILDYAKETGRKGLTQSYLDLLKRTASRNYFTFITDPSHKEAEAIAWMTGVVDQVHEEKDHARLARPLHVGDLYYVAKKQLGITLPADVRQLGFAWEEGSLALSSPFIRWVYRVLHFLLRLALRGFRKREGVSRWLRARYHSLLPHGIRHRINLARLGIRRFFSSSGP